MVEQVTMLSAEAEYRKLEKRMWENLRYEQCLIIVRYVFDESGSEKALLDIKKSPENVWEINDIWKWRTIICRNFMRYENPVPDKYGTHIEVAKVTRKWARYFELPRL